MCFIGGDILAGLTVRQERESNYRHIAPVDGTWTPRLLAISWAEFHLEWIYQ